MLQKFTTDLSRARQNVFVGTTEGVLFTLLVLGANEIRGVVCVPASLCIWQSADKDTGAVSF